MWQSDSTKGVGPRKSKCQWCNQFTCKHCRCPGYEGCDHKDGMCPRTKYNRRLVCNSCERHKLASREKYGNDNPTATRSEASSMNIEGESMSLGSIPMNPAGGNLMMKTNQSNGDIPLSSTYSSGISNAPTTQGASFNNPITEDAAGVQLPNFLQHDGKLYSFEGSNIVDHMPMMYGDGRVISFDKINSIFMPNDNLSFNSIDGLQHFLTTEDLYLPNTSQNSFMESRFADSGRFFNQPPKREASDNRISDGFGRPILVSEEGSSDYHYQGETISSIPVTTIPSGGESTNREYTDLVHLNVQYNKSSFAVVPINRSQHTLLDLRKYLDTLLLSTLPAKYNYSFLSKNGGIITHQQEDSILIWNEVVENEWTHHTFNTIIKRYHIFICFEKEDIIMTTIKRKRLDPDDEDDEQKKQHVKDLFMSASDKVQKEIAWDYLEQHNFNMSNESGENTKESVLSLAVKKNLVNVMNYLLMKGADVNFVDHQNNSLLHMASERNSKEIVMILLSILWRKSILFSGYPDFMLVNDAGQDAVDVCKDKNLAGLIKACIDRYSVVNVNNLKKEDSLQDIRNRILASCVLKESIRQAKFIVNDAIILPEQEASFPAYLCCYEENSFVIYIPPTIHILEQVGVEMTQSKEYVEKEALNMLIYSFSHLSLDPKNASFNTYKSTLSLTSNEKKVDIAPLRNTPVSDTKTAKPSSIYKEAGSSVTDEEKRKMIENNMKECNVYSVVS